MHKLLKRIQVLEEDTRPLITNMYYLNPKHKTVYRKVGRYAEEKKVYMDYDAVMGDEYTMAETLVALPNYDNPNWEEEHDGIWCLGVQGLNVINENN